MAGADPEVLARLRERAVAESQTAKWMTVALAAVGAVLLGAVQVADLAAIDDDGRAAVAVAGGVVATLGVVLAIMITVGAMLPAQATLQDLGRVESGEKDDEDLRKWLESNRAAVLRHENDSVRALIADYDAALKDMSEAFDAHFDDIDSPEKARRAQQTGDWTLYLNGVVSELVESAKLHQTQTAVGRSRIWVAGLGVAIAFSGIALIWAAGEPEAPALDLRGAKLDGAVLRDVKLRGVNLDGVTISRSDLRGSFLGEASIEDTVWKQTVCPDGTGSSNAGGTCAGHLTP